MLLFSLANTFKSHNIQKVQRGCYRLNVCTTYSYVDIISLNVIVLRDGAFGRWLGHEGVALINALIRDPNELRALLSCEDTGKIHLWTRKQVFTRHWICSTLIWTSSLLFISHTVYGIFWSSINGLWQGYTLKSYTSILFSLPPVFLTGKLYYQFLVSFQKVYLYLYR